MRDSEKDVKFINISDVKTINNNDNNNNFDNNYKNRSKWQKKSIATLALAIAIGGTSVGFGLGAGYSFMNKSNNVSEGKLSSEQIDGKHDVNIAPLSYKGSDVDIVKIIKEVQDSVVSINVSSSEQFFNRKVELASAGSGIIFKEDEDKIYIVTNNHVINGADSVNISIDDDIQVKANFVGKDPDADIAVISVSKKDMKKLGITSYKIAKFGNSDSMEVGETVIAMGNALGRGKSATLGIISVKSKNIKIDNNTFKMIQTDAAINEGNSGGALININGEVIGINSVKILGEGVEGMGYAIPASVFKPIVEDIINHGSVKKPYIGITGYGITEEVMKKYNMPSVGVYVVDVESDSGAGVAGVLPGDVIVGFNGKKIKSMEDLQSEVKKIKVSDSVDVEILRNNKSIHYKVTITDLNTNDF